MLPQPATTAAATGSSAVAASGQLSEAQFQTAMALFSGWWQENFPDQPPWVVQSVTLPVTQQVVQYLHLQRPVCSSTPAASQIDPGPPADSGPSQDAAAAAAPHSLEQEDVAGALGMPTLPRQQPQPPQQQQPPPQPPQQQQRQVHVHRYSVVWHEIYRVPVLYLAASRQDGCPLTLPELCQDLPQLRDYQGGATQASWTYISATAHPVTGAPCLMLHPCQTAARMQLLLQANQELPPPQGSAGSPDAVLPTASPSAAAAAGEAAAAGAELTAEASELLTYARGWFSMVVPLLGMSMLPQ